MKIIFFGTSQFAVPSLKALIASGHEIAAVVTQPDKKSGRHLKVGQSPVKQEAVKSGLTVLQPETPDAGFAEKLKSLKADLFCVIAYGHILKKEILNIPKFYSINLHASLLPKLRGAAPINWAIMNGETITGVSVMKMTEALDQGDVLAQEKVGIYQDDTAVSLAGKLAETGEKVLLDVIKDIEKGKEKPAAQDPNKISYARKLKKEDGLIDWKEDAVKINNKIRGLMPWPGAYTDYKGKMLKILKAEPVKENAQVPGRVIKAEGRTFIIGAGKGAVKVLELQLEAGKRMGAASFLRGHKIKEGHLFP